MFFFLSVDPGASISLKFKIKSPSKSGKCFQYFKVFANSRDTLGSILAVGFNVKGVCLSGGSPPSSGRSPSTSIEGKL